MTGNRLDPRYSTPRPGTLRGIPLLRAAAEVFGPSVPALPVATWTPAPRRDDDLFSFSAPAAVMTPREQAGSALRNAECARINVRIEYVRARAGIGAANARGQPASKWHRADLFTPEQIRRRRSMAFSRFNRALAALRAADRAVAAALAELALFAAA